MEFFDVVNARGSYRGQFEETPIPQSDLEKMLEAAIKAPSGYNLQSTDFVVVTDAALRKKIAEWIPSEAVETAPVIIAAVSQRLEADGFCFEMQDYASAVETLLLAITAMGYASVWMDGDTQDQGNDEKVRKLLGLPEDKTVRTILPVGKPKDTVIQAAKKDISERVTWI